MSKRVTKCTQRTEWWHLICMKSSLCRILVVTEDISAPFQLKQTNININIMHSRTLRTRLVAFMSTTLTIPPKILGIPYDLCFSIKI